MEQIELASLKTGDRITFRSPTRWGTGWVITRVVRGFYRNADAPALGRSPTVRYGGYDDFVVLAHEIVEVVQR